jgi:branched-chain amino acid transport system ATP-binding protein
VGLGSADLPEDHAVSLLEITGLTKQFGQLAAVRDVDLQIAAGERHAIIGANGAGKTSLFHLITGRLQPTAGNIRFRGAEITGLAPHRIVRMGLARSFQVTNIFPRLSVRENVRLGIQARRGQRWRSARAIMAATQEQASELLKRINLFNVEDKIAGTLSYGDQRRLEIGLALASDPILVLLDEPTAGMSLTASQEIVALLQETPRAITIVLIEHDIDVVLRFSDRVTVMHQGTILAQGKPREIERDARVQQAYFGEALQGETEAIP